MTLSLMNYVAWLHRGENMKLEDARKRAREVFSRQTQELIPIEVVVTPEEFEDLEVQQKLMRSRSLH